MKQASDHFAGAGEFIAGPPGDAYFDVDRVDRMVDRGSPVITQSIEAAGIGRLQWLAAVFGQLGELIVAKLPSCDYSGPIFGNGSNLLSINRNNKQ